MARFAHQGAHMRSAGGGGAQTRAQSAPPRLWGGGQWRGSPAMPVSRPGPPRASLHAAPGRRRRAGPGPGDVRVDASLGGGACGSRGWAPTAALGAAHRAARHKVVIATRLWGREPASWPAARRPCSPAKATSSEGGGACKTMKGSTARAHWLWVGLYIYIALLCDICLSWPRRDPKGQNDHEVACLKVVR